MRYDLWQGDLEPAIQQDLVGSGGLPVGTVVQFVIKQVNGSKRIVGVAVIDDPGSDTTPPVVHYQWASGDTDTSGVFRAVWKVLVGGAAPETFPSDEPIYIVIHPQL